MPSVASQPNHLPSHLHLSSARNHSEPDAKSNNSPFAMLLDSAAPTADAEAPPPPHARIEPPSRVKPSDSAPSGDQDQSPDQTAAPATDQAAAATDQAHPTVDKADPAIPPPAQNVDATIEDGPPLPPDDGKTAVVAAAKTDTNTATKSTVVTAKAAAVAAKTVEAQDGATAKTDVDADPDADPAETDQAVAEQTAAAFNVALADAPKPAPHAAFMPAPAAATPAAGTAAPEQPATPDPLAGLQGIGDNAAPAGQDAAPAAAKAATAEGGKAAAAPDDGAPESHADKFHVHLAADEVATKVTADTATSPQSHAGGAAKSDAVQAPNLWASPANAAAPAASAAAPTSNAAAAPQPTAVPLSGLAVEIATQASAGKHRFEIRLDPPELGRIDVRLDVDHDGHVTSRLVVDRADTLDLLKRDASELQRALQQAGLKTSDNALEFSLRQQAFGRDDTPSQGAAQIVVPDDDPAPLEAMRQGYGRLLGLGGGLDITV